MPLSNLFHVEIKSQLVVYFKTLSMNPIEAIKHTAYDKVLKLKDELWDVGDYVRDTMTHLITHDLN